MSDEYFEGTRPSRAQCLASRRTHHVENRGERTAREAPSGDRDDRGPQVLSGPGNWNHRDASIVASSQAREYDQYRLAVGSEMPRMEAASGMVNPTK